MPSAFPLACEVTRRVFHRRVYLRRARERHQLELRMGDYVRVSALTAASALPGDSNPHAHLPRAHADCLHPLRGAHGCPTTHVLDALERNHGLGLGLSDAQPHLPLPSAAFGGVAALRDGADRAAQRRVLSVTASRAAVHRRNGQTLESLATDAAAGGGGAGAAGSRRGGGACGPRAFSRVALGETHGEVVRVIALFEGPCGGAFAHVQRYAGSLSSVLGESGNPLELFRVSECATLPLAAVEAVVTVRDASVWSAHSRDVALPLLERVAARLEREAAPPPARPAARRRGVPRAQPLGSEPAVAAAVGAEAHVEAGEDASALAGDAEDAMELNEVADAGATAGAGGARTSASAAEAAAAEPAAASGVSVSRPSPSFDLTVAASVARWRELGGRAPLFASAAVNKDALGLLASGRLRAGGPAPWPAAARWLDLPNGGRGAPPAAEFFTQMHHDLFGAWTNVPAAEEAVVAASLTLREVDVFVRDGDKVVAGGAGGAPSRADSASAAAVSAAGSSSASSSSSSSAPAVDGAVPCPPGMRRVRAVQVCCPACNEKRVLAAQVAPRAIGPALDDEAEAGAVCAGVGAGAAMATSARDAASPLGPTGGSLRFPAITLGGVVYAVGQGAYFVPPKFGFAEADKEAAAAASAAARRAARAGTRAARSSLAAPSPSSSSSSPSSSAAAVAAADSVDVSSRDDDNNDSDDSDGDAATAPEDVMGLAHWRFDPRQTETETLIRRARATEACQLRDEPGRFPELVRKAPGARPPHAPTGIYPLALVLVTGIVRRAAPTGGRGGGRGVVGGGGGSSRFDLRQPHYEFEGVPLYRPEHAPAPEDTARTLPLQEVFAGRACEALRGIDAECAKGAFSLLRADDVEGAALAAELGLLPFDDVFVVRHAVDHFAAEAEAARPEAAAPARPSAACGASSGLARASASESEAPLSLATAGAPLLPLLQPRCRFRAVAASAPSGGVAAAGATPQLRHRPVLVSLAEAETDDAFDGDAFRLLPRLLGPRRRLLLAGAPLRSAAAAEAVQGRVLRAEAEPGEMEMDGDSGAAAEDSPPELRVAEFFAGCGGISSGMAQVPGVTPVLAVEKERDVARIYGLNAGPGATVLAVDASSVLEAMLGGGGGAGGRAPAAAADSGISALDTQWLAGLNRRRSGDPAASAGTEARGPSVEGARGAALRAVSSSPAGAGAGAAGAKATARPSAIHVLVGGPPCQGFSGASRVRDLDLRALTNVLAGVHVSLAERLRLSRVVLGDRGRGGARGGRETLNAFAGSG